MSIVQDYIESDQEREEGHMDTRYRNFECDTPDPALGCNLGIDVQGQFSKAELVGRQGRHFQIIKMSDSKKGGASSGSAFFLYFNFRSFKVLAILME